MTKKLFALWVGLLLPLVSHAAIQSITFNLLNDNSSVKNPIHVTGGYYEYQSYDNSGSTPAACISGAIPLPASLPIKVKVSSATKISIPITQEMKSCLENPSIFYTAIILHITEVDGKTKQGECGAYINTLSNTINLEATLNIRETKDTFYCSVLSITH